VEEVRMGIGSKLVAAALVSGAALLVLALFMSVADGQGLTNFGIRPANTSPDDAAKGAYFTYTLEPGASIDDEAMVVNDSQENLALKLYAADGITAINGGTAFAAADEERTGLRSWITTTISDLDMAQGDAVPVPFTIQVPADAAPGDHVAGWVVEGPPKTGGSGVAASVVERVGVAVVVHVPGPTEEHLSVGSLCLNQETGSNYFEASVENDGNVLTKANGNLLLTTKDGTEVFDRPVELGTVLPGDTTLLRLDAPFDPGPGSFVADLTLKQPDGTSIHSISDIRIGDEKVNGCKVVSPEDRPPSDSGSLVSSLPGDDFPWLIVVLAVLAALFALILGMREYVWRRRQR
jgi:hypothetical protein